MTSKQLIAAQQSRWYQKHRDKERIRQKEYYESHKAAILARQKVNKAIYHQTPECKEAHARMILKYPEKHEARCLVREAVRTGKLIKKPCEVCGNPKSEAHHDDYTKPLDVKWLCRLHHMKLEGRCN